MDRMLHIHRGRYLQVSNCCNGCINLIVHISAAFSHTRHCVTFRFLALVMRVVFAVGLSWKLLFITSLKISGEIPVVYHPSIYLYRVRFDNGTGLIFLS